MWMMARMAWHPLPTSKLLGITGKRITALQLVLLVPVVCAWLCVLPVLGKRLGSNLFQFAIGPIRRRANRLGRFCFPMFCWLPRTFYAFCNAVEAELGTQFRHNTVCRQPFSSTRLPDTVIAQPSGETNEGLGNFVQMAMRSSLEISWLPGIFVQTIEKTRCVWSLFLKVFSVPSCHPFAV